MDSSQTPRTHFSRQQLEAYIREKSADTANLFFTAHIQAQMRARRIVMATVLETLRRGRIKRKPEPNTMRGSLECRMEHFCAGHNIGVVVAVSDDDPNLILVTAMYT